MRVLPPQKFRRELSPLQLLSCFPFLCTRHNPTDRACWRQGRRGAIIPVREDVSKTIPVGSTNRNPPSHTQKSRRASIMACRHAGAFLTFEQAGREGGRNGFAPAGHPAEAG